MKGLELTLLPLEDLFSLVGICRGREEKGRRKGVKKERERRGERKREGRGRCRCSE